jgi:Do/DeqQ family serine protease
MHIRATHVWVLFAAVLASGSLGIALHAAFQRRLMSAAPAPVSTADGLQSAFVAVAERVRPAVVHLGTVQVARGERSLPPGFSTDDPTFRDFFERFFGRERGGTGGEFRLPGLGSGVIVDRRGDVLTNFHVVKGADAVTVRLSSRREYRGQIVGTDAKTDLAVVRFQPDSELTVAALGDSDRLRVGEWAIAIGNPFGLDQTVTVGVISATGRSDVGVAAYENFIQTDASINPGNSGGPLVNLRGEVIGINTAIVASGQGIGFAIPANMAKRVVTQLVARGRVTRGWLGVSVEPLGTELAQSLGIKGDSGAVVARVHSDSPAAAAGLRQSDVIVGFDGTPVADYHHLQRLVAETDVGKRITLDIVRGREKRAVVVRIAEAPDLGTPRR